MSSFMGGPFGGYAKDLRGIAAADLTYVIRRRQPADKPEKGARRPCSRKKHGFGSGNALVRQISAFT
jgi:hypothetical protein